MGTHDVQFCLGTSCFRRRIVVFLVVRTSDRGSPLTRQSLVGHALPPRIDQAFSASGSAGLWANRFIGSMPRTDTRRVDFIQLPGMPAGES